MTNVEREQGTDENETREEWIALAKENKECDARRNDEESEKAPGGMIRGGGRILRRVARRRLESQVMG